MDARGAGHARRSADWPSRPLRRALGQDRTHGLPGTIERHPGLRQDPRGEAAALSQDAEEKVLGPDVRAAGFAECELDHLLDALGWQDAAGHVRFLWAEMRQDGLSHVL